jgi:hypothetical protein
MSQQAASAASEAFFQLEEDHQQKHFTSHPCVCGGPTYRVKSLYDKILGGYSDA